MSKDDMIDRSIEILEGKILKCFQHSDWQERVRHLRWIIDSLFLSYDLNVE